MINSGKKPARQAVSLWAFYLWKILLTFIENLTYFNELSEIYHIQSIIGESNIYLVISLS